MLKQLSIQNLLLIDQVLISFHSGLNIITGETGSGKSAILHALRLVIGERADTSIIRRSCEKGIVEAIFEIENTIIPSLLMDGGIEHEHGQEMIIRREITQTGKGRIFINHQAAQLSFLRKIGCHLINLVGQHANQNLFSLDYHSDCIDLFGNLSPLLGEYQKNYDLEIQLKRELEQWIQQESQRVREMDRAEREIEEIEDSKIKEGEDDELFAEYSVLVNAEEISSKINEINRVLSGERQPLLSSLNHQKQSLEQILRLDSSLLELSHAFQNAFLELQEISHSLRQYQNRIQVDHNRLHFVSERLTLLNSLKRKYGGSIAEILHYQEKMIHQRKRLENSEIEIENLQKQIREIEANTQQLASELTQKRKEAAIRLEQEVTKHLQSLNMSKALFSIRIVPQKRYRKGEDHIEFFLSPNIGENQIPLRESVSGGELSRVLLALQTLLAGKEKISCLIFDEIDANIGGETATIIGDKLKEISRQHQVICITHFPQVARQADHHLQIWKDEKEGRTLTQVHELTLGTRQQELARMSGFRCP